VPLSNDFEEREIDTLRVSPKRIGRKDLFLPDGSFDNSDHLVESIELYSGLIQPIVCTRDGEIIFGERRFEAAKLAGLKKVLVRYTDNMTAVEMRELEFEENARRKPLRWQDHVSALTLLHASWSSVEGWTKEHSAERLGFDLDHLRRVLKVGDALIAGDQEIAQAKTWTDAKGLLDRREERQETRVVQELSEVVKSAEFPSVSELVGDKVVPVIVGVDPGVPEGDKSVELAVEEVITEEQVVSVRDSESPNILTESFSSWAESYSGDKFNFIHINDETQFITVLNHADKLCASTAHLMIWIPMSEIGSWANFIGAFHFWERPLIWHITDSLEGYRCAFCATRGDRELLKVLPPIYAAPSDRRWGTGALPEPMLRFFFSQFCDEYTRVLDPACGNAASLRAAESLGSEALGFESDPELALEALDEMKRFRALRRASR